MRKFIPVSMPSISQLEIDNVTDAVKSTWISSQGKYINQFEEKFAAFCGVDHAVSVVNGTAALHLILQALNIGAGCEVIVPDFTYVATANAVVHAGATPVFVDIDPFSLCMDPSKIEQKITKKTKAIIPVHIYGHPADMPQINKIAKKHKLSVIEDAAESHGSQINGKKSGSLAHAACFSFFANKNITTGEGGMITSNDTDLIERCRFLRNHAMSNSKRYWHTEVGFNYRLTNLQAAIGCAQLDRVEELIEKRQDIFKWYQQGLRSIQQIQLNRSYSWAKNTYWMVCLENESMNEDSRENLIAWLRSKGVDSRPYFYPCSSMPHFEKSDNPVSYSIYSKGIYLPTYFDLTKEDVEYICKTLKEYFQLTKL